MKIKSNFSTYIITAKNHKDYLNFIQNYKNNPQVKIEQKIPLTNTFIAKVHAQFISKAAENYSLFKNEKIQEIPDSYLKPLPSSTFKLDAVKDILGVNKIHQLGFTGKGIGIAFLDSGIYPHLDFGNRIVCFKDFINQKKIPYDDRGHGTHIAGDAAGGGLISQGKFKGMAPEADLISLKVLNKKGKGYTSNIIKAINWVIKHRKEYNIKVLNISFGFPVKISYKDDPIIKILAEAEKLGITIVAAAGNDGPEEKSIGSPANAPFILTVGALDDHDSIQKTDDSIYKFSSIGPTLIDNIPKPDLIAPGVRITGTNAIDSFLDKTKPALSHKGKYYLTLTGTSFASPITAGITALLIQANPNLKPKDIREILMKTAKALPNFSQNAQGKGVIDPASALNEALKLKLKNTLSLQI
ncbi:MAG: S8 family peptidase [Armatimonadetes bacterium]|nr:S8 family peptidase [Armatimonadota bacterium]